MNKERRRIALRRNIEMTQAALEHANELIRNKDGTVLSFPEKVEMFVKEMRQKLAAYQHELDQLNEAE